MRYLFLDIETIPSQQPWVRDYISYSIKPPATMKKPETIEKWELEERESAIEDAMDKCSFDGAMNHIICVSFAIDDGDVSSFVAESHDQEKETLERCFDAMRREIGSSGVCPVGHNIINFDLRVLKQRCMVLDVVKPSFIKTDAKPWEKNPYDTMLQWDQKNFVKLEKLALAFGIPMAKTMAGGDVYAAWKDGLYKEIGDYCANDVALVREIFRKMEGV